MDSTSGRWCPLLLPRSLFNRLFFCGKNSQSHSCRTMRAMVPALPITVGLPLCDNTQYSNHCVTSPITSLYQKSARSAITLFDSMYLCGPNVFVCDKYVTQVYQWTIRQLHFRPEWQVNICYCIVVTYQQITDRWLYEFQVCKKMHNMQTSYTLTNSLIKWNNHETRPQGGCSVGAHCVSQWTIRSAEEEPKYV